MKVIVIGPFPPIRGGIADATHAVCERLGETNTVVGISFSRLYPKLFFQNQRREKGEKGVHYSRSEMIDALNPISWWRAAHWINSQKPDRVIFVWWTTYLFPCYFFMKLFIRQPARTAALVHNVVPHSGDSA